MNHRNTTSQTAVGDEEGEVEEVEEVTAEEEEVVLEATETGEHHENHGRLALTTVVQTAICYKRKGSSLTIAQPATIPQ